VWRPLLTGESAREASDAVRQIAALLREPTAPAYDGAHRAEVSQARWNLGAGRAGTALLMAYLGDEDAAAALLEAAIANMNADDAAVEPGLWTGLTGLAWVRRHLIGGDEDDVDAWLDAQVAQGWRGPHDLVSGLVGIGVHALERLPSAAAAAALRHIVAQLAALAEPSPTGLAWRTPPSLLPPDHRARFPQGQYNLGVAHGVPGITAFLARAAHADVPGARRLLDGAMAWLLARSSWPSILGPDGEEVPTRPGWCYGEVGIAAALGMAAQAVREPAWASAALALARRAASRAVDEEPVYDAGLCHGAAGIGHLFNRLYQATGDEVLGEAGRRWLGRALGLCRPGQGIAGFGCWDAAAGWLDEPGLLKGAAGVALALLAAVSEEAPSWDRVLLVSF
jgi:hypothetical protein